MYVPDSLVRLNDEAAERQTNRLYRDPCDFCNQRRGTRLLEYYNPADEVRGIEGVYAVQIICDTCLDEGRETEEAFYCDGCGKLFVINHSWDVLAVSTEDGLSCQKCALDNLEPVSLARVLHDLGRENTHTWKRFNDIPGKDLLDRWSVDGGWEASKSTILKNLARNIVAAANDAGLDNNSLVYPVITFTGQFGVEVAIYID